MYPDGRRKLARKEKQVIYFTWPNNIHINLADKQTYLELLLPHTEQYNVASDEIISIRAKYLFIKEGEQVYRPLV